MVERTAASDFTIEAIRRAQFMSYVLIFSILLGSVALRREAFLAMWTLPSSTATLSSFLERLLLFFVTLIFILKWIANTAHEFNLWVEHLEYIFVRAQVYVAMLGLAFGLGLMLVLVYDVTIFAAYFTAFLVFNVWTQWLANDHFRRSAHKTVHTDKNRSVLEILEHYWLKRPQLKRIAGMALFSLASFIIALLGTLRGDEWEEPLHLLAGGVLVLTIVVGEFLIARWRTTRDYQLQHIVDAQSQAIAHAQEPQAPEEKRL
ncbi:MAG: hypothetical protein QOF89_4956 [Acidobacteriota bacterium]|jgi:hypothetical protein|nr:hypothetical protein [Acidobacteriota bacterium]